MEGALILPADPGTGSSPSPEEVLAGSASPEVGEEVSQGESYNLFAKINSNTAAQNILARVLAGLFVVGEGLEVNVGTGLTCTIDDGYAVIDGIVTVSGAQPYVLPASQSDIWLWLKQDGTFTHTLTTTPPAGKCAILAYLSTDATDVTGCDSTVAYRIRNGAVWRESSEDDGAPVDTPGADQRTFRQTMTGTYLWDGQEWKEIAKADSFPRWWTFTVTFGDLLAAATTKTVTLRQVPASTVIHAAKMRVLTGLSGGAIATVSLDLGKAGTPAAYVSALDGMAVGRGTYSGISFESDTATTDLTLKATSTGANLSALSAGIIEIQMLISIA